MGMSELKGCHCFILNIIKIVFLLLIINIAVGPEGEIGSANAYDMNGIRRAFCVDGKQEIYKEEGRYILK